MSKGEDRSPKKKHRNRHIDEFYENPAIRERLTPDEGRLFGFVSKALSHLGADRGSPGGRWAGVGEGPGQVERVSHLVRTGLGACGDKLRPECRTLLELMLQRAEEYLEGPNAEPLRCDGSHSPRVLAGRSSSSLCT